MTEIQKTEGEIKVLQAKLELLKEMESFKTPVEEAYKRVYGFYPETYEDSWSSFQDGYIASQKDYKVGEYQPTPQTPEQVADGLKEAFREAVKQGVVSSSNKPQNLYDLIADCMVKYNSIVYPELICDILDAVEEWLPDEHYSDGEDYDLGFNDCLNKIKGKLK